MALASTIPMITAPIASNRGFPTWASTELSVTPVSLLNLSGRYQNAAPMTRHQQAAAAIVAQQPYVDAFMSSIGAGGASSTANQGRMFMRLKPRGERPPVAKIIEDLRRKLSVIPGLRV